MHYTPADEAWWRDNGGVRRLRGVELSELIERRALERDRRRRRSACLHRRGATPSSSDYSSADGGGSPSFSPGRDASSSLGSPSPRRRPRDESDTGESDGSDSEASSSRTPDDRPHVRQRVAPLQQQGSKQRVRNIYEIGVRQSHLWRACFARLSPGTTLESTKSLFGALLLQAHIQALDAAGI